jgi:CheY-like chemotaxis protein
VNVKLSHRLVAIEGWEVARILVIDDDEVFVDMMVHALEERGHNVAFALDGLAGTKAFAASPFDAVICDLVMPNQEGLETIRHIRRERPGIAIVAVSGGLPRAPQVDVLDLASKFGADQTLRKPFKPSQLGTALDAALAARGEVPAEAVTLK